MAHAWCVSHTLRRLGCGLPGVAVGGVTWSEASPAGGAVRSGARDTPLAITGSGTPDTWRVHPTWDGSTWHEPVYPTHTKGAQAISLFNTAGNHVNIKSDSFAM